MTIETTCAPVTTLLSQSQLRDALLDRLRSKSFARRDTYVGASEVGQCPRVVAYRKIHGDDIDAEAAGRMRGGQIMENEVVQLVRLALGNAVRETGANQREIEIPDAPLRVHPDGRILGSAIQDVLASGAQILVMDETAQTVTLTDLPAGDGILEVKTASSHQFRRFLKGGLSYSYRLQTQVQAGSQGLGWGLLVLANRENLADIAVFYVSANADIYEEAKSRARRVIASVERIRDGIVTEEAGLPDPEPENGYCSKCVCADLCPAMVTARALAGTAAIIPPDEIPVVEALADEFLALKPDATRFEEVKEKLRDRLLSLGVLKSTLPSGRPLSLSERHRETVDQVALKSQFPAAADACIRRGAPYFVLSVKEAR